MAKRTSSGKKGGSKPADAPPNGGIVALTKELFQAAIVLRGSIEPADYKPYVLRGPSKTGQTRSLGPGTVVAKDT